MKFRLTVQLGKHQNTVNKLCAIASTFWMIAFCDVSYAGPFAPPPGNPGSTAIDAADSNILAWATGYENYLVGTDADLQWQTPERSLNHAGNSDGNEDGFTLDIASLGNNGEITLTFDPAIGNGEGFDFAVFENSFSASFLELAFVEVSSNGVDFFRFDAVSLTPPNPSDPDQCNVGPFDNTMDATDIDGLAGKYAGGYGTPFDLSDLPNDPALDKKNITHVKIIDIVGDGNELDDSSPANPICDPTPTSGSGGFDLDAVAVLNQSQADPVPEEVHVPLPNWAILVLGLIFVRSFKSRFNKHIN